MSTGDSDTFTIKVEYEDCVVSLGGGDEVFIELTEGFDTATLNDKRIALIRQLQMVQNEK